MLHIVPYKELDLLHPVAMQPETVVQWHQVFTPDPVVIMNSDSRKSTPQEICRLQGLQAYMKMQKQLN